MNEAQEPHGEKPNLSLDAIRKIMDADQDDAEVYGFLTDTKLREFHEETGDTP